MNLGTEKLKAENENVVPLFGQLNEEILIEDPLQALLEEGQIEDEIEVEVRMERRVLVTEEEFPDQSLYTLEEQLKNLRTNLNRIKFYLGELEDIIPAKNL